ncbi:MAG: hypothetical protein NW226_09145 [Microscillaceae bacterium]|nr:hypothetical protein [Microscillaceae bacterium]
MINESLQIFVFYNQIGDLSRLFLLQISNPKSHEPGIITFFVLLSAFILLLVAVVWWAIKANQNYTKTQTYSGNPYVLESYDHELAKEFMELNSMSHADIQLRDLAAQIQDMGLLSDSIFADFKRESLREFLEVELLHFKNKFLEKLDDKDKKRLLEDEKYLQRVIKAPGNTLNPNFNLVNTYIDQFIRSEGLWEKYRDQFTRDSIISIKAKFMANYKKLLEDIQVSGDQVLHFYLHSIKKFERNPEAFLTSKQVSPEQIKSILSKTSPNHSTNNTPKKKKIYPLGGKKFEGGGSTGDW